MCVFLFFFFLITQNNDCISSYKKCICLLAPCCLCCCVVLCGLKITVNVSGRAGLGRIMHGLGSAWFCGPELSSNPYTRTGSNFSFFPPTNLTIPLASACYTFPSFSAWLPIESEWLPLRQPEPTFDCVWAHLHSIHFLSVQFCTYHASSGASTSGFVKRLRHCSRVKCPALAVSLREPGSSSYSSSLELTRTYSFRRSLFFHTSSRVASSGRSANASSAGFEGEVEKNKAGMLDFLSS